MWLVFPCPREGCRDEEAPPADQWRPCRRGGRPGPTLLPSLLPRAVRPVL